MQTPGSSWDLLPWSFGEWGLRPGLAQALGLVSVHTTAGQPRACATEEERSWEPQRMLLHGPALDLLTLGVLGGAWASTGPGGDPETAALSEDSCCPLPVTWRRSGPPAPCW